MALLYIGAGTDASPLLLKQYTEFIFVDQCPDNTTGHMGFTFEGRRKVMIPYKRFYQNVRRRILHLGMTITSTQKQDKLWVFTIDRNQKQITLRYHVNRVFPKIPKKVQDEIAGCKALYISGYCPDVKVFDMTKSLRIIYSTGREANEMAEFGVKKLGLSPTSSELKLRYYDLLQHGDSFVERLTALF
jgi:hypothetical protein